MASMTELARAMRDTLDPSIADNAIPIMACNMLTDTTPQMIMGFISGAREHQRRVADEDSKFFKGRIIEVNRIKRTRGDGGGVLGEKAEIVLESTAKGGKVQEEKILTHWVSFAGAERPEDCADPVIAFEMALSQSIEEDCTGMIGQDVLMRKAFVEAETSNGGSRVRFVADVRPQNGRSDSDDSGGSDRGGRGRSSRGSGSGRGDRGSRTGRADRSGGSKVSFVLADIKDACRELGVDYDKDFDAALRVDFGDDDRAGEDLAAAFGISKTPDVNDFCDDYLDQRKRRPEIEAAVYVMNEWL